MMKRFMQWVCLVLLMSVLTTACFQASVPEVIPVTVPATGVVEVAEPTSQVDVTDVVEVKPVPSLTWTGNAALVTPYWLPVIPQSVYPLGVPIVYTTFSYQDMSDGVAWSYRWYRNGDLYWESETLAWDLGDQGQMAVWLQNPQGGLPNGSYEVQVTIDGQATLTSTFAVLNAEHVLNALEAAGNAEDMAVYLQCAFSIAGLGWLLDGEVSEAWLNLGELQFQGNVITAQEVYDSVVNQSYSEDEGRPFDADYSLDKALARLSEAMARALDQPGNPDSAFYILLNGRRSGRLAPQDKLTILEADLLAYWLLGGEPGLQQSEVHLISGASGHSPYTARAKNFTAQQPQVKKKNAYIFIGDLKDLGGYLEKVKEAKESLERHFNETKGWSVTTFEGESATTQQFINLAKDPQTAAIGFIGHASPSSISLFDGTVDPRYCPDVVALHGGLEEVVLLGCQAGAPFNNPDLPKRLLTGLLVKDPAHQAVASPYVLCPSDLSRMAKELEKKKKPELVDTHPGLRSIYSLTMHNLGIRVYNLLVFLGIYKEYKEYYELPEYKGPGIGKPVLHPVNWMEMHAAQRYILLGLTPPVK